MARLEEVPGGLRPANRLGGRLIAAPDLEQRLAALTRLPRGELVAQFEKAYRKAPPPRLSDWVLALAIAYRWQEEVHGGLAADLRRSLLSGKPVAAPPRASPGTVLIREWQGREHTVIVHPDGVEYAGQRFRSLTEVTLRITGQKRSGPAFFGLRR